MGAEDVCPPRRARGERLAPNMKVLVAEDSLLYQRLLLGCLGDWGFEPLPVKDGAHAWDVLQRPDSPKLALLGWVLPGIDGLELCRRLRKRTDCPYVYTILLTANGRKDELIEGLDAGADDYLIKPFDNQELRVRLQTGSRVVRLQEELMSAHAALRDLAAHDPLTNLLNRREIFEFLRRELHRARRQREPVGLIMADVDFFKKVNDTFGHLAGDHVLMEVAHRLRSQLRTYDGIGRYGGEEFLMVMPGCEASVARQRAEHLRQCVAASAICAPGHTVRVTVSMGVTCSTPGEMAPEALLEAADSALYKAKQNGRNRVEERLAARGAPA